MRVTDTASFIAKSKIVHGDRYDYSDTSYTNARTKLKIKCNIHGIFNQNPRGHITGQGCPKCGGTGKLTDLEFKNKCKKIHNNKYDYSKTIYDGMKKQISITCDIHGDFSQSAIEHYRGHGCLKCGRMSSGFGKERFILACKKNGNIGTLYLMECTGNNEVFYKIGITSKTIKSRIVNIPYECNILSYVKSSAVNVFMTEKKIHKKLKAYKYDPLINFFGETECFWNLSVEVRDFFGVQDA